MREKDLSYLVSAPDGFPHRPCCHNVLQKNPPREWATSLETALARVDQAWEEELNDSGDEKKPPAIAA